MQQLADGGTLLVLTDVEYQPPRYPKALMAVAIFGLALGAGTVGLVPLSIAGTILRAITVQGSHLGSHEELKNVVAWARAGQIKPIPIQIRPLAEVSRTLDELKAGSIVGRVVAKI